MNRRPLSEPETYVMDSADEARVQVMIDQAEHDIAEHPEVRVNFRWGRDQVDTLRRAAAMYGVPYQTYLKIVALRAAQDDLSRAGSERNGHRGSAEPTPPTAEEELARK